MMTSDGKGNDKGKEKAERLLQEVRRLRDRFESEMRGIEGRQDAVLDRLREDIDRKKGEEVRKRIEEIADDE